MNPSWLGPFYGANFGQLECETIAIQFIPRDRRLPDAELMQTKWFDYRRLHPVQATYFMVECYSRAYGDFTRMAIDKKLQYRRGIKGSDFFQRREHLSFWKLRQLIDSLGIRYDFFMHHAARWCFEHGWLQPPRPQHITSNESMVADIVIAWESECSARMQFAADSWFRTERFEGHSTQRAYEQAIVTQIKQRQHAKFSLHASLYIYDAIRFETALVEFGEHLVGQAISLNASLQLSHS